MLRTFPFTNFICRFFDTIVTKDHRLNFNRSVMLRDVAMGLIAVADPDRYIGGGGGGYPDP